MALASALYPHLPHSLRVAAATLWGYRLRRRRYGPDLDDRVAAISVRERWSSEQWRHWQDECLGAILERAATRVPHYRKVWSERRRRGDNSSWLELSNWPVLDKRIVQADPRAFLADDVSERLYEDHTSGTTGSPLRIYATRDTIRDWYALYEARVRRWHGVRFGEPWAILGGQVVVPYARRRPPYWVRNLAMSQLYLSTNHLSDETVTAYHRALSKFRPTHLVFYPSSATVLASAILSAGLPPVPIRAAFANGEPLFDHQRDVIARAFDARVVETYGMGEIVGGASECESGRLHVWPESGVLEVLHPDDPTPCSPGEAGRLVWTGLVNRDMPLIRYDVGDRATGLQPVECPCGRTLPVLSPIEGRSADMIVTPDGRRVFWINPVFYALPIREAQIVQERPDAIKVAVVPLPSYGEEHRRELESRLRVRLGDITIAIEIVPAIPRTSGGKLRPVVSLVDRQRTDG